MPADRHHILSLDEFRDLVERDAPIPDDVVLLKSSTFRAKLIAGDDRAVQLTISDATEDRDADTIAVEGWDITNYQRNPVVLFSHSYSEPPVARATKVFTEDLKLKAVDHFIERDIYPFADTVFQMVKGGYLNAASVGFLPRKFERVDPNSDRPDADRGRRGGIDFQQQELLEHSIVPVPSNPAALVEARSALKGCDWSAYRSVLERYLDEDDLPAPRRIVERAWRATSTRRSVVVPEDPVAAALDLLGIKVQDDRDELDLATVDPTTLAQVVGDATGRAVDRAIARAMGRLPEDGVL